jgi:hypothetical protein
MMLLKLDRTMKHMTYQILKFNQKYFESFAKLLIDNFEFDNKDKRASIFWKFFHPFLQDKTVTYIALYKNKIVSQYSNIPYPVSFNNHQYKTMLCADMATDENHRGQKLISKLSAKVYEDVEKQNYDFSIGFSNDDGIKVDKNAKNYNYQIVGAFVRYFRFLIFPTHSEFQLIKVKDFDKNWVDTNENYLHVLKDYAFLQFRYVKKPHNTYTIYKFMYDQVNQGYVVIRKVGKIVYIYDIILEKYRKEIIIAALKGIESALQKECRVLIINVMDNSFWKDIFKKAHYLTKKHNKINHHLTVKIHNEKLDRELFIDTKRLRDKDNWFLMNGDIL